MQSIKPVFMMSPLSVAQFLEPGTIEFDLLVIDEASQVQPVDALGAIARCQRIVVVGDSKQLPPTRFFSHLMSETTDSEDEEEYMQAAEAKDIESLAPAIKPYSEAKFKVPQGKDPHELSTKEMSGILVRIIEHEGPIHEDELVARVRDLWERGRAGNRI